MLVRACGETQELLGWRAPPGASLRTLQCSSLALLVLGRILLQLQGLPVVRRTMRTACVVVALLPHLKWHYSSSAGVKNYTSPATLENHRGLRAG